MKLLLFDLDGTLLKAGGIGRRSTRIALEALFESAGNLDYFYPGGRTQEAIFLDTLLDMGISRQDFAKARDELYKVFLTQFREGVQTGKHGIEPLPGAIDLISDLSRNQDMILGIVTGNHTENARQKLVLAGFDPEWFSVGAFGEEEYHRPDLVPLAKSRALEITGKEFPDKTTIVLGDTTRDVLSAKSAGAVSIAVTTGTDDHDLLASVEPDYILDGLLDQARFERS
jgi:phosphoglycolate phosphatase-like HAD superfamily hydrolase